MPKVRARYKIAEQDWESLLTSPETSYEGQAFDILLHAWMARFTNWLSPASLGLALYDWLAHLALLPAKRVDMVQSFAEKMVQTGIELIECFVENNFQLCFEPRSNDQRFKNELWKEFPFSLYAKSFLLLEEWLDEATHSIRGVSKHHRHVVNFTARQCLDIFSPSNSPATNPEVLLKAYQTGGQNFIDGARNLFEDVSRNIRNLPPVGIEKFELGVNIAATPGKVIYRNHLIELIQYTPTTSSVSPEPILIVPAWIMKYYILDLSPHNSLVKYLVDQGHTVFMISWKNPGREDRNLGMGDYLNLGIMNALEAIEKIVPGEQIHSVGYCLGGTLLMIAAAAMAGRGEERIKTITLFAAQVDFKEAGELLLFMDQSEVTYLEDSMWETGYLDDKQMANTFSMLHSNELIWSRMIREYLLGERRPMNDLMAWDSDTTRLPYKMHSEYLHYLFLNNDLSQGRFKVDGKKIALPDIRKPIFSVATLTDHISPWKSVYKVHLFTDTEITFTLTSGGHNAGIVSEPGHKGRHFQIQTRKREAKYITPESWQEEAEERKGSWWPAWDTWLVEHSGEKVKPPIMGNPEKGYVPICDAPGTYVFEK